MTTETNGYKTTRIEYHSIEPMPAKLARFLVNWEGQWDEDRVVGYEFTFHWDNFHHFMLTLRHWKGIYREDEEGYPTDEDIEEAIAWGKQQPDTRFGIQVEVPDWRKAVKR